MEELVAHGGVRRVLATPDGGARLRLHLANTAHLRAEVVCFEVHGDAVGMHERVERIRDLVPHSLLHREPSGPEADEPGQLGDPDDLFVSDVADIRVANEGQRVMLAEGDKWDWPLHDLVDLARGTTLAFR